MKKSLISTCLLCLLLSGCSKNYSGDVKVVEEPTSSGNQTSEPSQNTELSDFYEVNTYDYLDEGEYEEGSLEREIVKVINLRTKYYNARDKENYASLFTKDSGLQDLGEPEKKKIIKIENLRFYKVDENDVTVYITEKVNSNNEGLSGDSQYSLKKENHQWKIYFID